MYSLLDPFALITKPSVYVISESQMAEYKRNQAKAEIAELERLIDGHKSSIERLEATVTSLRKEYTLNSTTPDV